MLTFEAIQGKSEDWRTKRAFSPWTSLEFRLTLKHTDAGDIWIEIHFASSSHFSFWQILYRQGEHKLLHLLRLKHLWQWNQSFRGQNSFELICIFSGTMNRGIGSDSSLHHNAWSLELKTKDNSSLPQRSRLWDMDFNKVGFNLLVFNRHYLENWVRVFNSFMKLCETEQQCSVTSGHFLRALRIYSEVNAFLSF